MEISVGSEMSLIALSVEMQWDGKPSAIELWVTKEKVLRDVRMAGASILAELSAEERASLKQFLAEVENWDALCIKEGL